MPIQPNDFQTGGALQSDIAASLIRHREAESLPKAGGSIGNYRIIDELGRGGMAIVFRAERADGEYEQQVALKWMLESHANLASAELFLRERQALASLNHPNIARLLDGGRTAEGRPWFVMELVEGLPIDRHCVDNGLPLAHRLELFAQVCAAVAFAHARGLIHRDIKPSNVLVDRESQVKLLDFGIARLLGEEDELGACAHTPGFASPEQKLGHTLTVASDIYQLGRLLGAMVHERTEQSATTFDASKSSTLPSEKFKRLPVDLRAIIAKACAEEPSARYATVDSLTSDIRSLVERRPVSAQPRRARYLATRYLQRHPVAVGASVLALLTIAIGSALFTVRLQHERDKATYQAKVATSVLDFLREDLLAAADPGAVPGRELSVREALDLASNAVDARFADKPVERGAIRTTLAGLYDQLGRYDEAEREARKAVTLAATSDSSDEAVYSAETALIDVLLSRGKLDEADALIRKNLTSTTNDRRGEDRHAEMQLFESRLLNLRGKFDEALGLANGVIQMQARAGHSDSPLTSRAAEESAANLQMLGRHDEALPLLMAIHASRLTHLGPLHPSTLLAAHEIGLLKRHEGEDDEALRWLQQSYDRRRQVLGENHPDTLSSANEVATVLQALKRYDEAEVLFKQVLDARADLLGEEHQFTRNSMSNLGLLYSLSGRLELAAPLYERALAIETRLIGESHPDTIALMHNMAGLYRKQGRIDDALAMHERVLANAVTSLGADAWQTGLFRAGRALTLQAAKRYDDADDDFFVAIQNLESSLGHDHPRTARARQMRAELQSERATPR